MRHDPASLAVVETMIALVGCGASPTAPGRTAAPEFDPAVLFARLAGSYTLTFEADESCPLPPALKVLTYDAVLERTRYRYLGVRIPSNPNVIGDLWVLAREEQGFTLRWNVDCETGNFHLLQELGERGVETIEGALGTT